MNERTRLLRPQDRFIRDNIRENDILIVSIGGNDVALCPTPCTIVSMLGVLSLPVTCVENGWSCGVVPVRDESFEQVQREDLSIPPDLDLTCSCIHLVR